jgi:N-acetylneuraminate synthase
MSAPRTLIIAEAGVNHNGSLDMALRLVEAAAAAAADIVKFQTFNTAKLIARHAPKARYQQRTGAAGESQFEMVRRLELEPAAFAAIARHCAVCGIEFLSTPFDEDSLELLVGSLPVRRLKLPSGEITNAPLLLRAGRCGLPLILSTGMASLGEIEEALGVLAFGRLARDGEPATPGRSAFAAAWNKPEGRAALAGTVTLLHCTSEYPAPLEQVHLRAMDTLGRAFGLEVGYSDHTEGLAVPVAAVALGATVIEKHFTLDRTLPGPDHRASLEPAELAAMVTAIRATEQALGEPRKGLQAGEADTRHVARKSLVAARALAAGTPFSAETLTAKRPGGGRSPFDYWDLLNRPASRAYAEDEAIDLRE